MCRFLGVARDRHDGDLDQSWHRDVGEADEILEARLLDGLAERDGVGGALAGSPCPPTCIQVSWRVCHRSSTRAERGSITMPRR